MSYIAAKREDTLNCYFTRLSDFMKITKKLFLIDDFDYFIFWLSKMQDIDNRATFLFLKKNQDKLTDIQMRYVSEYYRRIWGTVNGQGANLLGTILMEIREEFQKEPDENTFNESNALIYRNIRRDYRCIIMSDKKIGFTALVETIGSVFFNEHKNSAVFSSEETEDGLFCFLGIDLHSDKRQITLSCDMNEWDIYATCYVKNKKAILDKCKLPWGG